MFHPENLLKILSSLKKIDCFYVAYSGGLDSHVLLHSLSKPDQLYTKIKAIHINHQLSPNALEWETHCKSVCRDLKIPYQVLKVDAHSKSGESPEAAARKARYDAFTKIIGANQCLLTAHHQDDQAETVLLQLFRGSGPQGLSAMPELTKFSKGYLLRPLLNTSRAELKDYATKHHLNWIDDESNFDTRFDRNYLRQEVIPLLEKKWPSISNILARVANINAEVSDCLRQLAELDLHEIIQEKDAVNIEKLKFLSFERQKNVIRYWIQKQNLNLPSYKLLEKVLSEVVDADIDADPILCWHAVEVRRYQGALFLMPPIKKFDTTQIIPWDFSQPLILPNQLGTLNPKNLIEQGLHLESTENLSIRFRQGGERFHPEGRIGSHPLKKLMQEWQIPPWERDRIPLLYQNETLIAVVGYAVSKSP